MPFTPFHMGPGLLIKAVLQGCFSLVVFGWAQILMDLQPLFSILAGMGALHGFSHTFAGAVLIACCAAVTGWYLSPPLLRRLVDELTAGQVQLLAVPGRISVPVCLLSAFVGCISHVLLDGIMHADVQPWFPDGSTSRWYLVVSISELYRYCVYSGLAGAALFLAIRLALVRRAATLPRDTGV